MLNFKLKSSILMVTLASISLHAQDYKVADILPVQQEKPLELASSNSTAQVSKTMSSPEQRNPSCPDDFYALPLYPNAKFCQLFAEELPASMSYFAISDQQTAKAFYLEQLGQAEDEKMLKGRIVLQYANGQKVVVISKDGQGSQIDILIKSAG